MVSRTLVDRKTGTVVLFAFDRGQGISEQRLYSAALLVGEYLKLKLTR